MSDGGSIHTQRVILEPVCLTSVSESTEQHLQGDPSSGSGNWREQVSKGGRRSVSARREAYGERGAVRGVGREPHGPLRD